VIAGLLVFALVGSLFVPVPYFILAPGSVRATEQLVHVPEGRAYPPEDGEVFFTTVSSREANLLPALIGWLDPDTDVVEREAVLGDRDPEENRQVNQQLMAGSKEVAAEVAFEHFGLDVESGTGAVVGSVVVDLPVAEHLEPGDVIIAVDGEPVEVDDDLVRVIRSHAPGDVVRLRVEDPDGEVRRERVQLGLRPGTEDEPLLGVGGLETRDQVYDFPFPVEIDTGQVGGPSAGLAFTLALLDVMTPGELTGGNDIAVTGTIDDFGNVGPIGGIGQKAAAVRDAGADVFIVPAGLVEQARAHAGDVEVVGVATLDEALEVLDRFGGNALDLDLPGVEEGPEGQQEPG
jgi:PDZ domain-containing protein